MYIQSKIPYQFDEMNGEIRYYTLSKQIWTQYYYHRILSIIVIIHL